jgi:hypothetical protein
MTALRVELATREATWLRELVLGDEEEVRLLALVRDGHVIQALRTGAHPLGGPLRSPPELRVAPGSARELWSLPESHGVERVVAIDAEAASQGGSPSLLAHLLNGALTADPGWLVALRSLRRLTRRVGLPLRALIPDGVYALVGRAEPDRAPLALCLSLRDGRPERLLGADALDLDETLSDPAALAAVIRRRVGRPHLVAIGAHGAIRTLLESPRPASTLEHMRIRGEIQMLAVSGRLSLALLALRLLGR